MKKTIYMALGAFMMITNLANAAAVESHDPNSESYLSTLKLLGPGPDPDNLRDLQVVLQNFASISCLENAAPGSNFMNILMQGIRDYQARDYKIFKKLEEKFGNGEDHRYYGVPFAEMLGQASEALADIYITPEETALWTLLYTMRPLYVGFHFRPPYHPVVGGRAPRWEDVDLPATIANLNAKIQAYREAVGLPPLAAVDAGVAGAHA